MTGSVLDAGAIVKTLPALECRERIRVAALRDVLPLVFLDVADADYVEDVVVSDCRSPVVRLGILEYLPPQCRHLGAGRYLHQRCSVRRLTGTALLYLSRVWF